MGSGGDGRLGDRGEAIAAAHLAEAGWRIVDRNWRPHGVGLRGELDLVVSRDGLLAFVEVKTRRSHRYGGPFHAVTREKQRRIRLLATAYLAASPLRPRTVRFDVIGIDLADGEPRLRHLEGAF